VAVYEDLLDAIAGSARAPVTPTRGCAGCPAPTSLAANLVAVRTPGAIDTVLAKIRGGHPELFDPPPAAPATPGGEPQPGANRVRRPKRSEPRKPLAHQNSTTAQVDLQVITAVLNAHASDVGARAVLDGLQRDVEAAVAGRTDLDTPAGARGFQRYLIDKLRDIRTVVETAGLDATSKAALVAALASLYATPCPRPRTGPPPRPNPRPSRRTAPPAPDTADEALLDDLLGPDAEPRRG
jgi:hypothetical protein